MSVTPSLVDIWTAENNSIVRKWKEYENGRQSLQDMRKRCYEEFLRLHQKVQGVPAILGQLKLEITVLYNTLLFSLGYCTLNETKDHIINALVRALEAVQKQVSTTDLVTLWQVVLRTFGGTADEPWIHKLLLIQWLIWLSECQFEKIVHLFLQTNQTLSAPSGDLLAETRNLGVSIQEDSSLLVALAAKDLKELLHISTFISNGVEQMKKENYTEARLALQEAMTLPSHRTLLAHVHVLTGLSYAKLQQPQSALQCYRKALEMDFGCQKALYQSSLVYRQLGNCHAEIEALRLLHSATLLHAERGSSSTPNPLISPDMLLGGEQTAFICQTPSPLQVLYALGNRCVLSGRNSEGAECYLDLLASLQSDPTPHAPMKDILPLPRIPVIYLEAAFALLKSRRFWDALAVCDEVIATTVDLVPETLLIKLPITTELEALHPEPDAPERLECVLWSGAAYFLQGQAHFQLKDTKEALTSFTRAINQLVKVRIKQKCKNYFLPHLLTCIRVEDSVEAGAVDHSVVALEALKAKVLAIRGLCFVERGRLNEALRDFQLSLQASKGCRNTEMWLVEVMWRLDRKEEAAAMWKQIHNSTESSTLVELPLYVQTWQEDGTRLDQNDLNKKMEEFIAGRVV